jgi:phage gp29-like protein
MADPNPIRSAIANWLEWLVPSRSTKGWYNYRGSEPSFIANLMDVDRLRQVIASAETGNVRDLFGLYRDVIMADSHVQSEMLKRKLAVLGDALSLQPADKTNADDVAARDAIKDQLDAVPNFTFACGHLLDGCLFPLAMLERWYVPSTRPGLRYDLGGLNIVPANIIDYTTGWMKLRKLDQQGGYMTADLEDADPNRYIIHRGHLLSEADFWGGPMRSILFWWLLRSMGRDWWARFLERYGAPFIVGKYDQSDDASRAILTQAFNAATKIFGLVVSNETEVELMEAATSSTGEAFERFVDRCNDEISKLIVGQTASSNMKSTGLGSGVSQQHESVRQDLRQFDSKMLGETLRDQLFRPFLLINGLTGAPPRAVWGGLSPDEQESLGDTVSKLSSAGLELTDEGIETVSEQLGIPFQRKAPPPALPGLGGDMADPDGEKPRPFSAPGLLPLAARGNSADAGQASVDRVAAEGAASLAQAFRGSLAPVRRIILESSSAEECQARIHEFYADWDPKRIAGLTEEALVAFAANGAANRAV